MPHGKWQGFLHSDELGLLLKERTLTHHSIVSFTPLLKRFPLVLIHDLPCLHCCIPLHARRAVLQEVLLGPAYLCGRVNLLARRILLIGVFLLDVNLLGGPSRLVGLWVLLRGGCRLLGLVMANSAGLLGLILGGRRLLRLVSNLSGRDVDLLIDGSLTSILMTLPILFQQDLCHCTQVMDHAHLTGKPDWSHLLFCRRRRGVLRHQCMNFMKIKNQSLHFPLPHT